VKTDLQTVNFGNQTVFFELHEHLFLYGRLILSSKVCELFVEGFLFEFILLGILVQFLFLLLHTAMVYLLELLLLLELVVSRLRLQCNHSRFIKLFLHGCQRVRKFGIFAVDFRDLGQLGHVDFAFSL
jgi:hypothetical protein